MGSMSGGLTLLHPGEASHYPLGARERLGVFAAGDRVFALWRMYSHTKVARANNSSSGAPTLTPNSTGGGLGGGGKENSA